MEHMPFACFKSANLIALRVIPQLLVPRIEIRVCVGCVAEWGLTTSAFVPGFWRSLFTQKNAPLLLTKKIGRGLYLCFRRSEWNAAKMTKGWPHPCAKGANRMLLMYNTLRSSARAWGRTLITTVRGLRFPTLPVCNVRILKLRLTSHKRSPPEEMHDALIKVGRVGTARLDLPCDTLLPPSCAHTINPALQYSCTHTICPKPYAQIFRGHHVAAAHHGSKVLRVWEFRTRVSIYIRPKSWSPSAPGFADGRRLNGWLVVAGDSTPRYSYDPPL